MRPMVLSARGGPHGDKFSHRGDDGGVADPDEEKAINQPGWPAICEPKDKDTGDDQ